MPIGRPSRALTWGAGLAAAYLFSLPSVAQTPHPDFSGIWYPSGTRPSPAPPLTEGAQKLRDEYEAQFTLDDDPGRFCI